MYKISFVFESLTYAPQQEGHSKGPAIKQHTWDRWLAQGHFQQMLGDKDVLKLLIPHLKDSAFIHTCKSMGHLCNRWTHRPSPNEALMCPITAWQTK